MVHFIMITKQIMNQPLKTVFNLQKTTDKATLNVIMSKSEAG